MWDGPQDTPAAETGTFEDFCRIPAIVSNLRPLVRRFRRYKGLSARPEQQRRREGTMPKFLLSVYQPQGGLPSREFLEKVRQDLDTVNRELKAAGAWFFADGLHPLNASAVARFKDGEVQISDGPYSEAKEFL